MTRSDYSHVKRYLEVWFEETGPKHWYKKSDAFDADIRRRFEKIAIDLRQMVRLGKCLQTVI